MKSITKKLNLGFEWYKNNLKSASSSIQSQIDRLIKMRQPATLTEINQIINQESEEIESILKKLNKPDLLALSKDFKISVTPTAKKSEIISRLLNNRQILSFIPSNAPDTRLDIYDDPSVKALALLKLHDLANEHQLLKTNKKLPNHIQKSIDAVSNHSEKALNIYMNQTGGAIETVTTGTSPIIIGTAIGGLLLVTIIALGLFRWFRQPASVTGAMNEYSTTIQNRYSEADKKCIRCRQCKIIPRPQIDSTTRIHAIEAYNTLIGRVKDMCESCSNCPCPEGCPDYYAVINENNRQIWALIADNSKIAVQEQRSGHDLDFYKI